MQALLWMIVFAANPAQAETKFKLPVAFCAPMQEVAAQVEECEANDLFVEKGEECLTKLDEESKRLAGTLPTGFSDNLDQKQNEKFASSNQDYQATSQGLAQMIALTQLSIGQIKDYKNNLAEAPDSDEPEINGGNAYAYSMSVDCYGANAKNLDSLLEDFQSRLKKLQATKKTTDAFAAKTQNSKTQIQVESAGQKLIKGNGKGEDEHATGQTKTIDSDVTGVEKDKASQKELK